ncbi:MAG: hypothetical protein ACREQ5_30025 [Candidatus Dormibacteria bacterium]
MTSWSSTSRPSSEGLDVRLQLWVDAGQHGGLHRHGEDDDATYDLRITVDQSVPQARSRVASRVVMGHHVRLRGGLVDAADLVPRAVEAALGPPAPRVPPVAPLLGEQLELDQNSASWGVGRRASAISVQRTMAHELDGRRAVRRRQDHPPHVVVRGVVQRMLDDVPPIRVGERRAHRTLWKYGLRCRLASARRHEQPRHG